MKLDLLLYKMSEIESKTGKMMHELNKQLEDDIWDAIDSKETYKYSYLLNQLNLTLDDYFYEGV